MKYKKNLLVIVIALVLGAIGGAIYSIIDIQPQASETAQVSGNLKIVSEGMVSKNQAIDNIKFKEKIKFPDESKVPFEIGIVQEEITSLYNGHKVFHRYYADVSQEFVLEVNVTDANIEEITEMDSKIMLNDNTEAWYLDNGSVELVYWKDKGLTYYLIVHSNKIEDVDQLELTNGLKLDKDNRVIFGSTVLANVINNMY